MSTSLRIWAYAEEWRDILFDSHREAVWLWFHRAELTFPDCDWLRLTPDVIARLDRA